MDTHNYGKDVKVLARIIHEDFYRNHRYAAMTSLTAGGLAAQSVNILFQVCLSSSRLHAPVSLGVSAVSSRTLVNNVGWTHQNLRRDMSYGRLMGAGVFYICE